MRRKGFAAAAAAALAALGLAALASSSPSGQWRPGTSLLQARSGAAAVALPDGRVLFSGGRDGSVALASAETLGSAGAQAVADMSRPRSRHAAALLPEGRVLVAGGELLGGWATASVEVFDPRPGRWSALPDMHVARAGHTLTTLRDGGLLAAGGDSTGVPSALLEVFDPAGETFYEAGVLTTPRTHHAAALLDDGRVLIAGGSDGARALASTEIFDPDSGRVSAGPMLQQARAGLTATTLADGRVLIVGGHDDGGALATAEVLDAGASAFTLLDETLLVPRSGHLALRLPHNNNVLIVSGAAATPLASAELYTPVTGGFDATGALAVSRALASGQALGEEGQLLLGGGANESGTLGSSEIYVFHTVRSDRGDYAPGETVTILGRRWQPGETVTLVLHESPRTHDEITLTAVADANGDFVNRDFTPEMHDLGVKFIVDAIGQDSGLTAQTAFTDGTLNVVSAPAGVSFTLLATRYNNTNNCSGNSQGTTTHSVSTSGPSPALPNNNLTSSSSFRLLAATSSSAGGAFQNWNCTNTTNYLVLGANPRDICVSGNNGGGIITTCTATYAVKFNTTTTVTDTPDPSVVGQPVTVNVTVTPAGGSGVPSGSVVVTVSGGSETCTATLSGGSGSCPLTFISTGSRTLIASYGGDAGFSASSGVATHAVNRADSSTTISSVTPEPSLVGQAYTVSWNVAAVAPGAGTPGGTVIVSDGTQSCSGAAPSGSCQLTATNAGSVSLSASYGGDAAFHASTSAATPHSVNAAATSVSASDSPDPTVVGESYSVSWTVDVTAPGAGTPTGAVTVNDGSGNSCSGTAPSGNCLLPSGSSGSRTVTVNYAGDGNFAASSGNTTHTVNAAATTTTISSDNPDPSVVGQPYTVSWSVAVSSPGAGTPAGTVTVSDGDGHECSGSAPSGSCQLTSWSAGDKNLLASYAGNADFGSSSGGAVHTVAQADTETTLGSTPNPSIYGQPVTFSAEVCAAGDGAGSPGGFVEFSIDGAPLASALLVPGVPCPVATTSSAALGAGAHTVSAHYQGDGNFKASSDSLAQTVNKADTATTITSDAADPSVVGESYSVTWTVSAVAPGAGTPGGTVTVSDGAGASCNAEASVGHCELASSGSGVHTLSASYAGDDNFNGSSGSNTHTVNKAATTTLVTSDTPDPSVVGQSYAVSWTVSVNAPGSGTPTGTVSVSDGSGGHCAAAVEVGVCTLSSTSAGPKTVSVSYGGDADFEASGASTAHTVDKAATSTAITADTPDPSVVGEPYAVSWTVSVNAPGSGTPTGMVTISDGQGESCSAPAGDGQCSLASSVVGALTLTANYGGDANFEASNGSTDHQVNKADTTTGISGDTPDPSLVGQSYTVSWTVSVNAPGSGTPTGTVTVSDGLGETCAAPVGDGGCALTATSAGARTLSASYAGDARFNASSGSAGHQVDKAATTMTISGDTPAPSVVGQPYAVSWTVTVDAPGSGTPTGAVNVSDGSGGSCSAAVAAGTCTLTSTSAGAKTLTASYGGDANFEASSDMNAHQVDKAGTTLDLTGVAPEPTVTGQAYRVYWTLDVNAPGAGSPGGVVQVSDGSGGGCAAAASAGYCDMASLSAGHKTMQASYGGDANFNGDDDTLGGHQVNPAGTTTMVTSSLNPSTFGASVTFTATVCPVPPGAGVPGGMVTFSVDGVPQSLTLLGWSGSGCPTATYSTAGLSAGSHGVQASYAGDTDFLASGGDVTQGVNALAVTETVSVSPSPRQYSDIVTFTATIDPAAVNGLAPASSASFYVGSQLMGTDTSAQMIGGKLVWTLDAALLEPTPYGTAPTGQMAPGSRTVTAVFGGVNANFSVDNATTTLTIDREDARATYSGALFVGTASATATTGKATLAATIQDISATADAAGDTSAGDIRNATVTFVNRDGGDAVLCTASVGLVDTGDPRSGTASCEATLSVGSCPSAPCSQQYTVGVVVNGYYSRNAATDNTVVTVSQPGTNFITGGGYLLLASSAGQVAGATGSKNNFGFNVKYNKSKTNLQGKLNSIVRNGGRVYQIKGNSMTSLAVQTTSAGGTATFNGKATIQDITNPLNVIPVDGNATLQVTMTDNGEPGSGDRIGITVWNKNGGLWFSSSWNGSKTVEQGLGGGNLVVH